ncbi:MAG TPA: 2-phospho-L-lactate transferase CofD family protein [Nitrososphaerales archaeon]|nr:2-phospho-L-lactate transferase CofD family protein [Nitrososphaerales archaeon]
MRKQVGVLCGGSGSSKFVSAIAGYATQDVDPKFVANVGDNFWYHGLYVCPDIDILTYTLSGMLDSVKGWGITGDAFLGKDALSRSAGFSEWFSLGDRDLGTCLRRTELLRKGWTLGSITHELGAKLGARYPVIPATDDSVQTYVRSKVGNLHLQEYWVKHSGNLEPLGVQYVGVQHAKPAEEFFQIARSPIIICPANPVTSILPTLNLKGIRSKLSKTKVLVISPFVGDRPFSGPAASLMRALKMEPNSLGVAKLYAEFLKLFFLDKNESPEIVSSIRGMGIECVLTDTKIGTETDKKKIAQELVSSL